MTEMYDFSGITTAYEVLCNDGRVIRDGAFAHQEGQTVPIVWHHQNRDITNVLGTIRLTRNESPLGVRGKATFNNTKQGEQAKILVHSKAIDSLSIWANEIVETVGRFELEPGVVANKSVTGGVIREVSLVPVGANPGAKIDEVIRHSTDPLDPDSWVHDGLIIHSGIKIDLEDLVSEQEEEIEEEELEHGETTEEESTEEESTEEESTEEESTEEESTEETEDEHLSHEDGDDVETVGSIYSTLTEEQRQVADSILHTALTGEIPPGSDDEEEEDGPTFEEVFNTLSEKQKYVVHYLAGALSEEDDDESEESEENTISQGDPDMRKTFNPFETQPEGRDMVKHQGVIDLLDKAKKTSHPSLRELFKEHEYDDDVIRHSVTDIDFMFPDARAVQPGGPELWADREMGWVPKVLNGVHPRMFGRIKSWYANISADAARAKGYVTGDEKVEEVLAILKRVTEPKTVYKFQKIDRDDLVDITDFNFIVWLKSEMRLMLDEELARAILISDGRTDVDEEKITEVNIRPIYNDSDVYTHKAVFNDVSNEQDWGLFDDAEALQFVDHIATAMGYYQGAGSPTLFCQPRLVSKMLTVRDTTGRRIHESVGSLAAAMLVGRIVEVPVMNALEEADVVDPTGADQNGDAIPAGTYDIATMGVIVNLSDYTVGADRGGAVAFFDDFDLNFNKLEYLIETRISGALTKPKSAIAVNLVTAKTA